MVDKNFSCDLVDSFNRFCFTMYITLIKSSLYILYIFACYLYIVVVCFIYSRTLAPGATVICWLYPTQNKFYLILSYLILFINASLCLNELMTRQDWIGIVANWYSAYIFVIFIFTYIHICVCTVNLIPTIYIYIYIYMCRVLCFSFSHVAVKFNYIHFSQSWIHHFCRVILDLFLSLMVAVWSPLSLRFTAYMAG